MVTVREISIAIYGAWRFAVLDRTAAHFFENSPAAFWKSFNAALFAAPGYILLVLLSLIDRPVEAGELRIACVETIAYVIGWILFPLIMLSFTETVGRGRLYFRFIGAWNWSIVLQVYFFLGITALASSDALPASLGALLSLAATLAALAYQGFIAHATLGIGLPVATAIVLVDLGIGVGLSLLTRSFY